MMNIKWINYHDYYKERDNVVRQRQEQLLPYYVYGAIKRGSFIATAVTSSAKISGYEYHTAVSVEDLFYRIIQSMYTLCADMLGTRYVPLNVDINKDEVVFMFDERFKDEFFASDYYQLFIKTFESIKSTEAPKELLERIGLFYEAEKKLNKHAAELKNAVLYYSKYLLMTEESHMVRGSFVESELENATRPDPVLMDKITKELPGLREDYLAKEINVDKETMVWEWKDRPENPFKKIHDDLLSYDTETTEDEYEDVHDEDTSYDSEEEEDDEEEVEVVKKPVTNKKVQEELF